MQQDPFKPREFDSLGNWMTTQELTPGFEISGRDFVLVFTWNGPISPLRITREPVAGGTPWPVFSLSVGWEQIRDDRDPQLPSKVYPVPHITRRTDCRCATYHRAAPSVPPCT
jgi:hypothetical protein